MESNRVKYGNHKIKQFLLLALAIVMAIGLSVPGCAADLPTVDTPEVTDPESGIMPLAGLYGDTVYSTSGTWTSTEFSATASNGNYIRYWFQNNTNQNVRVYLYRTDWSTSTYASMMIVSANDQNNAVYHTSTAGSGTYKIVVEAYVSGDTISGDVSVAQYRSRP